MGHSSVGAAPVYRYRRRPGVPPVSVTRFDMETAHGGLPPDHRHAHDFLVLVYVEEGEGSVIIDGAERPLRGGEVHAVSPGQVIGATELAEPGRLGAHEAISAMLTRLLVAAARLAPSAPGRPDPLVEQVFAEIEATFRERVSAADVARTLGYTPDTSRPCSAGAPAVPCSNGSSNGA